MDKYEIKPRTKIMARKLGVSIRPSTRKSKKIDVYDKEGKYITSVGARGYGDYPTYLQTTDKKTAETKKQNYKKRHDKYRHIKDSRSYYADQLLWT
jgi:hypothetical protein